GGAGAWLAEVVGDLFGGRQLVISARLETDRRLRRRHFRLGQGHGNAETRKRGGGEYGSGRAAHDVQRGGILFDADDSTQATMRLAGVAMICPGCAREMTTMTLA